MGDLEIACFVVLKSATGCGRKDFGTVTLHILIWGCTCVEVCQNPSENLAESSAPVAEMTVIRVADFCITAP